MNPVLPEKLNFVLEWAPKSVLDVGCRDGALVHALRSRGITANGVDIVKYPHMRQGDAAHLSKQFKKKSYDIVCLFDVLEHVDNDVRVLKEARKVAKKYVLFSVPNAEPDKDTGWFGFVNAPHADLTHKRHYTRTELASLLRKSRSAKEHWMVGEVQRRGYLNPVGLGLFALGLPAPLASKIGTAFNLYWPYGRKFKGTFYVCVEAAK